MMPAPAPLAPFPARASRAMAKPDNRGFCLSASLHAISPWPSSPSPTPHLAFGHVALLDNAAFSLELASGSA